MDMKKIAIATTVDLELCDGSIAKCTFSMYRLQLLRNKNKALAEHAIRVITKGTEDVFEILKAVYAAYVCANMDEENLLTEEEFTIACGSDFIGVMQAFRQMVDPKNRQASASPS